jgi:drug/metabolite transporter (DMT)-like permease
MLPLFLLLRIVSNPFSNVFQKLLARWADPLFIICVTHGVLSVVCVPVCVYTLPTVREGFWPNIFLCAVLAVVGNSLIVQALKLSDLSILGPINAYKSVVSLIPGMLLLREIPSALGLSGVILTIVGSYFLVESKGRGAGENVFFRFFGDRGIQYRFAALIVSATEAVFLKKAILASSPLAAFAFWAVIGFVLSAMALPLFLKGRGVREQVGTVRARWGWYLMLALTTGVMQLSTLLTFSALQVGYSLSLFQISTVLTVVLGHHVFREPHLWKRLVGSLIMAGGAVLILLSR